MKPQVRYIVKAKKDENIAEETLSSRDQMDRWIKLLQTNGWRVVSKNTKVVRI